MIVHAQTAKQRLRRELEPFGASASIVIAYLLLKAAVFYASPHAGMISLTNPADLADWLLGCIVLLLRLCVVVVVPGLVIYRLLERIKCLAGKSGCDPHR